MTLFAPSNQPLAVLQAVPCSFVPAVVGPHYFWYPHLA